MKFKLINLTFKQIFFLGIYYGILRYFPSSGFPILGKLSRKLRYFTCKQIFQYCGKNVNIERLAFFASGTRLRIGDNSGLGINCHVPADTVIGKDVMMGPNCYIFQSNHKFDRTDIPMIRQGFGMSHKTTIGDDVWIGRNVTILPGKNIGNSSILAACCVVTKDVPNLAIVGGNPAKVIKVRQK